MDKSIENKITSYLLDNNLKIATVESCTGGLLSSAFTDISGSSNFIELNLVTYSNEAKQKMLKVNENTLLKHGAVSEECSFEMAKGLYELTNANICVSTTGIAGPTGGSPEKPVGLMYSTIFTLQKSKTYKILLNSDTPRILMKQLFVKEVLKNLSHFLEL